MVPAEQIQPTLSPNHTKIEETNGKEEEDRISTLPDCLLVEILSRLPSTKDAIRTGTLSKRWESLWISVSSIVFNQVNNIKPTSHFVRSVMKTLCQFLDCNLNIKKFEIHIIDDDEFEFQVNVCISYAISRGVKELTLTITNGCWNGYSHKAESLLYQLIFTNSSLTHLKLAGCILDPHGAISWNKLRNLSLRNVELDEDLIENILSGSPVLETLLLTDCYGYDRLNITSKSLKNLVFDGYFNSICNYDYVDVIKINAPYILTLKIKGDLLLWKILLQDVSSVVEAELDYMKLGHYVTTARRDKEKMMKGLINSLRNAKVFKVGVLCSSVISRLKTKGFRFPSNMKFPDVYNTDTDTTEEEDSVDSDTPDNADSELPSTGHGPNGDEFN